jgi:hypothetical protein
MPILGGLDAANKIRSFNTEKSLQQMPIICMSAADLNENDLQLAGINALCRKPLSQDTIVGLLKKYNLIPPPLPVGDISADILIIPAPLERKTNDAGHSDTILSMQESSEEDSYDEDLEHEATLRF